VTENRDVFEDLSVALQVSHTSPKSIGRAKNRCEILTASEESGEANPTGKQPGTFTSDSLADKILELRIQ